MKILNAENVEKLTRKAFAKRGYTNVPPLNIERIMMLIEERIADTATAIHDMHLAILSITHEDEFYILDYAIETFMLFNKKIKFINHTHVVSKRTLDAMDDDDF